jgi:hypothetical protein
MLHPSKHYTIVVLYYCNTERITESQCLNQACHGVSMAVLTNPRHEAFAQVLARGMSASAYVEAYKASTTDALG